MSQLSNDTIGVTTSRFRQFIYEMKASLSGQRRDGRFVSEVILGDRSRFRLRRLTASQDKYIDNAHSFMLSQFGAEEAETKEWLYHAIADSINTVFVALNSDDKIVGLSNSQYLSLSGDTAKVRNRSILAVWHLSVDKSVRGLGLAKHLQFSMLRDAYLVAKRSCHHFVGVCGEVVETAEAIMNRLYCKRMYYPDQRGNLHEVPYVCPPVDYDAETGKLTGPAVPEHLMLGIIANNGNITSKILLNIVWAMYLEYLGTRADYKSKGAYDRARKFLKSMLRGIDEQLSSSGGDELILLSRDERSLLRRKLRRLGRRIFDMENAGKGFLISDSHRGGSNRRPNERLVFE